MEASKYITATKRHPIFTAECTGWGYIQTGMYKDTFINDNEGGLLVSTFATSYMNAITSLHEWIRNNPEVIDEYIDCTFTIRALDGTWDKDKGRYGEVVVYKISALKAKKYILDPAPDTYANKYLVSQKYYKQSDFTPAYLNGVRTYCRYKIVFTDDSECTVVLTSKRRSLLQTQKMGVYIKTVEAMGFMTIMGGVHPKLENEYKR